MQPDTLPSEESRISLRIHDARGESLPYRFSMIRTLRTVLACAPLTLAADPMPLKYPDSHPGTTVETLHGIEVADPYRWLEDLNSKQTATWVKEQNEITESFLAEIPGKEAISKHLTELWNYERFGIPFEEGGRYFFSKNDGLQDQSVLYSTASLDEEATILLDPNKLSEDGTVSLGSYSVSPNGKYLAYSISRSGSDWVEWKVRNIESGEDLSDHLKWSKFSGADWSKDNKGFYYGRFAEPEEGDEFTAKNTDKKIYYHRLGEEQDQRSCSFTNVPIIRFGASTPSVTDDGRYLLALYFARDRYQERALSIATLSMTPTVRGSRAL